MKIQHFYDQKTATFTYIVSDEKTQKSSETLLPVLQFNKRAVSFGEPENNSTFYIKIPINKV